jgi:hypothetical protein
METINRVKRQPTEAGKIFANCISDNGSIYEIYKELNSKKILKRGNRLK